MCVIFVALKQHPDYPFIIAGNRDEFIKRPSLKAHFWTTNPSLFAGKDLEAGGTWMGITKQGRVSAITNYRGALLDIDNVISRGKLVLNYLNSSNSPKDYKKNHISDPQKYQGFNLLYGDTSQLHYFSNRSEKIDVLTKGVFGLSNHLLDSPWHKVNHGKELFSKIIAKKGFKPMDLLDLLRDPTKEPETKEDKELEEAGFTTEMRNYVSSIYIEGSSSYGTIFNTILTVDNVGKVNFIENSFNNSKYIWELNETDFELEN